MVRGEHKKYVHLSPYNVTLKTPQKSYTQATHISPKAIPINRITRIEKIFLKQTIHSSFTHFHRTNNRE
jgi:hypothetical protein